MVVRERRETRRLELMIQSTFKIYSGTPSSSFWYDSFDFVFFIPVFPTSTILIIRVETILKFAGIEKSKHFTCLIWLKILKINILKLRVRGFTT